MVYAYVCVNEDVSITIISLNPVPGPVLGMTQLPPQGDERMNCVYTCKWVVHVRV